MRYVATIGFFDGVHRGHLFLIQQLIQRAEQEHLSSMIITFDEHPRQILEGQSPELLLTREEREERLKQSGVRQVLEFTFSVIQNMTAEEFMRILHEHCDVDVLLMGYDHRFGSDRLQDFESYRQAGLHVGIQVELAQPLQSSCIVHCQSSTAIRRALQNGQIDQANDMLGYRYSLTGTVVHGKHIGSQLGFPTANLSLPTGKLIPKAGVYIARLTDSPTHQLTPCLVNIGTNPTFGDNPLTVEVHIPDWHDELYHQTLTVELLAFLRDEQRFSSQQALQAQIEADLLALKQYK
ncbi:MAG: riboflavin biosynthesis protein RibF [Paludibacteraceae bacterium]|nr:riboflavin biosynthesis protein RibF [Paludibacteraceae bacterium]